MVNLFNILTNLSKLPGLGWRVRCVWESFKEGALQGYYCWNGIYRWTSTSFQIFWHQSLRQFHLNLENFLWNLLYVTCLLVRARKHLFLAMGIVHTFDLICRSSSAHRGGVGSRSRPRPPGGWCHSSPPVSAPCAAAPQTLTCWTWSCSPAPRRATACKSRTTPRRRWPFTHPTHCCPPHPTPSHHSQHSS